MARIFLSHAHADRELAGKLATLLKNALDLRGAHDVFCSSREGAGVTPGAEIRQEVIQHLTSASALIVLLTPQSVGSPWVWFEAGARLAGPTRENPLFVVPGERFKALPNVIGDLRALSLDNTGEAHELVAAVAARLGTSPSAVGAYSADADELTATAKRKYSRFNETRLRVASWATAHALLLLVIGIGTVALMAALGSRAKSAAAAQAAEAGNTEAILLANEEKRQAVGTFLKWQGQLLSSRPASAGEPLTAGEPCVESAERGPNQVPIAMATVMAWRSDTRGVKDDPASCREPECAHDTTSGDGKFEIDLTKIKITRGEQIVLVVKAPSLQPVSCRLNINVNTEGRTTSIANQIQRLTVTPAGPGPNVGLH